MKDVVLFNSKKDKVKFSVYLFLTCFSMFFLIISSLIPYDICWDSCSNSAYSFMYSEAIFFFTLVAIVPILIPIFFMFCTIRTIFLYRKNAFSGVPKKIVLITLVFSVLVNLFQAWVPIGKLTIEYDKKLYASIVKSSETEDYTQYKTEVSEYCSHYPDFIKRHKEACMYLSP